MKSNKQKKITNKQLLNRLEERSQGRVSAQAVNRKLADAEERRLKQQDEKVRKARVAAKSEKREQYKLMEEQKALQLKRIFEEKKRLAENNRKQLERETKKKLEMEAQHVKEVAAKAKELKQREVAGATQENKENTNVDENKLTSQITEDSK